MSSEIENKTPQENHEENGPTGQKTSLGLEENLSGLLCYLFGAITGIIFYILEKDNEYIKFHALQSIFTFGPLLIFTFIISIIPFGIFLNLLLWPVWLGLAIFLMYKAYKMERYKLPVVGDMVENQLNKD